MLIINSIQRTQINVRFGMKAFFDASFYYYFYFYDKTL